MWDFNPINTNVSWYNVLAGVLTIYTESKKIISRG